MDKKGTTFIELLVAVSLLFIIFLLIGLVFDTGISGFSRASTNNINSINIRNVVSGLHRVLVASSVQDVRVTSGAGGVSDRLIIGNTAYELINGELRLDRDVINTNSRVYTLAIGIHSFNVELSGNLIEVTAAVENQSGEIESISTIIRIRDRKRGEFSEFKK